MGAKLTHNNVLSPNEPAWMSISLAVPQTICVKIDDIEKDNEIKPITPKAYFKWSGACATRNKREVFETRRSL